MLQLRRYLGYYKKQVVIGPIFKWLEAVFELIVPLVMARIIDVGIRKQQDPLYILKMGGIMVLLGLVGLCFALICQYSASIASQGIGTRLRNDLFVHINTLSHAQLDQIGTASLITRITNDVNQMQVVVAMLIRLVVRAPFLVIGATIMAVLIDAKLAVIFLIAAVLLALVLYLVMSHSIPYFRVIQRKLDQVGLLVRENLSGVRVIRAFSKQQKEKERFDEAVEDVAKTAVSVGKISALLNPMNFVILNVAIIAIVWFGGGRVYAGDLTQGEVIALYTYMTQILLALVVVANLVVVFTKGSASAARINEVFALTSELKDGMILAESGQMPGRQDLELLDAMTIAAKSQIAKSQTEVFQTSVPKLVLHDVSYTYPSSEEPALSHISAVIMAGSTVGIIGGTGSGKSTLAGLLPRFYDATEGTIRLDGIDLKDYSLRSLRRKFGYVPQKAVLFYGTIAENMRWGKKDATEEEIWEALSIAQALDFVKQLPNKEQTMVMQGGKNFSGGQKQRLTIARALIAKPDILILDDSASALDYATDAALRKAITGSTQGMTVFLISQRASSLRHADQILVLDDGALVGAGTHEELLETCEVYQEICYSQLSEEEVKRA